MSLALAGFLLSAYAFSVEQSLKKDQKFKAVCDLSERMSCTRAFTSKYGKIFGISNSLFGIIFYATIFVLAYFGLSNFSFYLIVASAIATIYLIYALFFKVKTFCSVCFAIYLLNFSLLAASLVNVF